jgi:hypothetical protein
MSGKSKHLLKEISLPVNLAEFDRNTPETTRSSTSACAIFATLTIDQKQGSSQKSSKQADFMIRNLYDYWDSLKIVCLQAATTAVMRRQKI